MAAENINHQRDMALPHHDAMLPADVCRQPTGRPHALRTYGHPRRAGLKQWGVHKGESRGAREPHPRFRYLLSSSHSSSPLVGFLHPRPFTFNVLEMFSFTRMVSSVSAALALASVSSVLAAPVHNNVSPLVSRATAPSPAFVIYTDKFVSGDVLPPATQLAVSVLARERNDDGHSPMRCFPRATTSWRCPS